MLSKLDANFGKTCEMLVHDSTFNNTLQDSVADCVFVLLQPDCLS